ncbi:rhodanese-like domain-containing protein [Caminibacter pacificus]|uniref:Rhodanese-like domain-containing protein n=1 Tax=Caminibacter pacificus TaxID=1424653 RepID=A0AAJ4UXE8_9BACT|nr:rhodanese-like domain-containing protein [Caminibacter pacificus]QCI29141.1 rhodanese-like domain-containing protein [Caminibacter pacificus]ROR39040.1 rhodanese-related sulfurtransferase [Caminibacter pacificus]
MKKLLLTGLLTAGFLFAYNPLDGVKAQKQAALKIVGDSFINIKQLKNWIKNNKNFQIVDVREPMEWNAGQIDYLETINLPRGVLYGGVKSGALKPNKTYVIVCRTGHRALLAAATLKKWYNFKHVYVLKGGIKAWIQSGGVVVNSLHLGPVKIQLVK